jgi:hypothetical protein
MIAGCELLATTVLFVGVATGDAFIKMRGSSVSNITGVSAANSLLLFRLDLLDLRPHSRDIAYPRGSEFVWISDRWSNYRHG